VTRHAPRRATLTAAAAATPGSGLVYADDVRQPVAVDVAGAADLVVRELEPRPGDALGEAACHQLDGGRDAPAVDDERLAGRRRDDVHQAVAVDVPDDLGACERSSSPVTRNPRSPGASRDAGALRSRAP
jgi:hypothetical protein